MDILTQLKDFIRPELLIAVPVLYFIGIGMKKSEAIKDNRIPVLLGLFGVLLATLWVSATTTFNTWQDAVMAVFAAVTQGVLCAGGSVFVNQLIKQSQNDK